jgi:hypothetical protein
LVSEPDSNKFSGDLKAFAKDGFLEKLDLTVDKILCGKIYGFRK